MLPSNNIEPSEVNSITLLNSGLRLNDHIPASVSADCSGFMAAPATSHVPPMHSLSVGSSSQLPPNYVHYGNSYHVGFIAEDNNNIGNTHADNRRAGFKRKGPATAMVFDEGNSSGYYSGGSSSNFSIPPDHLSSNPVPAPPQTAAWNPMHRAPGYRINTLPVTEEAPQRNVRRRHSLASHHEAPVNTSSHNSYPTGNVSGLQLAGQSSQTPAPVVFQRRIFPSGVNSSLFIHTIFDPLICMSLLIVFPFALASQEMVFQMSMLRLMVHTYLMLLEVEIQGRQCQFIMCLLDKSR